MPSLSELQRRFDRYLIAGPQSEPDEQLLELIAPHPLGAVDQLRIHKNNVHTSLGGALADTFPVVRRLVGDAFFRFAARVYATRHPPTSASLLEYGVRFPDFLRAFEPAATVPYLPDVAELEYLYLDAYHAAEAEPLSASDYSAALEDPDRRRRLRLHPSARLMASAHAVTHIWALNARNAPIGQNVRLPAGPEHVLLVRPRAGVEVRVLPVAVWQVLSAMLDGIDYDRARAVVASRCPTDDIDEQLRSPAAGGIFQIEESIL